MEINAQNKATPVKIALAEASRATGADFGFLLATAKRESALNPMAEAKTSSATGLFQFLDQSWLLTLKRHGAKHGFGNYSSMIETNSEGRAFVSDPMMRANILNLRYNPKISALMAAEFAKDNAAYIRARTGIEPQTGDLYAAHFLGAGGAAELINAAMDTPNIKAASLFPAAASANRNVFYRDGRALSASEVLEGLRATTKGIDSSTGFEIPEGPKEDINPALMMAQIEASWNNSLVNMLLGNSDQQNSFQPQLLGQIAQAQQAYSQTEAMQFATEAMNSPSIAQALSPITEDETKPKALRGRLLSD